MGVGDYSGNRLEVTGVGEWRLPVGDYTPYFLHVRLGRLRFLAQNNQHADGQRQAVKSQVFGIQVRRDAPFVLDFSNKPEVLFVSPIKESVFHPGDKIQVYAVVIDPVLDIMITDVCDTSRKQKRNYGEGETDLSLAPTVTITDASGKTVAEGLLPFG